MTQTERQQERENFSSLGYGLFIHFGLYAIPGGYWNGERAPHGSEWLMRNLQVPLADYKKLADVFNPTALSAKYYVKKAKEWGMQYLVLTAKHHDGFALYDTAVSDYSVMHTPYGKDIVREFADACREEGMPFGIYYSQMQDWEHPDADGNTWDFPDKEKKDFSRYFYEKALPQVKELLTKYGDVFLMWFDTPYDMPKELCRELADTVHALQPSCLVNGRIGYGLGDYRQMADNSIPMLAYHGAWEVPMTLNSSWGYCKHDLSCSTPETIIRKLVSVRSRGGNILLNVSPDETGVISDVSVKALDEVAAWIKRNGACFYNAVAAPDFPYLKRFGNVGCGKDGSLYLFVENYPDFPYRVSLLGLKNRVLRASLLADGSELRFSQSYEVARDERRLYVFLPEKMPDAPVTVIKLEIEGAPEAQALS